MIGAAVALGIAMTSEHLRAHARNSLVAMVRASWLRGLGVALATLLIAVFVPVRAEAQTPALTVVNTGPQGR